MQSSELDRRLQIVRDIARLAGEAVLQYYAEKVEVEWKAPGNPVTAADHAANALILEQLHRHFPGEAVLAEETDDDMSRLGHDVVWMVDPLDGTKEFIKRNGEFSIMIGFGVGYWLSTVFDNSIFIILGLIVGIIAGFRQVYLMGKKFK